MLPAVGSLAGVGARIVPWRQLAIGIINVSHRLTAPRPSPTPCSPTHLLSLTLPVLCPFNPHISSIRPCDLSCCARLIRPAACPAILKCSHPTMRFHLPLPFAFHIVFISDRTFGVFAKSSMVGVECSGNAQGQCWPGAVTWRRDTMRWYPLCAVTRSAGIVRLNVEGLYI
jgi:hypothetical protein